MFGKPVVLVLSEFESKTDNRQQIRAELKIPQAIYRLNLKSKESHARKKNRFCQFKISNCFQCLKFLMAVVIKNLRH